MSNDFSDIMKAMATVPDVDIDPETGASVSKGKVLGKTYNMSNVNNEENKKIVE